MIKIVLLSGIPASGKSTYAANLALNIDAIVICADTIRGELSVPPGNESDQSNSGVIFSQIMPLRIKRAIGDGFSVIVDVTAVDKKTRRKFIELADENDIPIECHYFVPNLKRALKWNQNRTRVVPEFVFEKMVGKWVEPLVSEGFSQVLNVTVP